MHTSHNLPCAISMFTGKTGDMYDQWKNNSFIFYGLNYNQIPSDLL